MKKKIILFAAVSMLVLSQSGCSDYLDPLPNGRYNSENYTKYPEIIRGYVDQAYNLLPYTYYRAEYVGSDAISDDACYRDQNDATRLLGVGLAIPTNYSFSNVWTRDFKGIYYTNLFLKDNIGYNTRYLIDMKSDQLLRQYLQGDAYALRAYFQYELLKTFAGKSADGKLLGYPIMTSPASMDDVNGTALERDSFDDCVAQILADCDSACVYLPLANRDFLLTDGVQAGSVAGASRYKAFDQIAVTGLKAMTYLLWASPAFNPNNDTERYKMAAENALKVINHKLTAESATIVPGGFDPSKSFQWTDTDSPEIVWLSRSSTGATIETNFYPQGFNGGASVAPTQELVDAFPMANGFPITDSRSEYDPTKPYIGRDPRFYSSIYYNGSAVRRSDNKKMTYIFDTTSDGKDCAGGVGTSPTNYYVKKFVYSNWNKNDETVENGTRAIFFMRWTQMCLIFAEAANQAYGPVDNTAGLSAKDAIAYLRRRPTNENVDGIGAATDIYLDECAADKERFAELVRNEWRIETCFEGQRFFNLRRWATDLSQINVPVHKVAILRNANGTLSYDYSQTVETRQFPSIWLPIPYGEIRRAPSMVQNAGWESWK